MYTAGKFCRQMPSRVLVLLAHIKHGITTDEKEDCQDRMKQQLHEISMLALLAGEKFCYQILHLQFLCLSVCDIPFGYNFSI